MFTLYLDDYIITRDGKVINKRNGHILKPQKNGKGYLRVSIGRKLQFVHRLVAEKYIPNPENKPQVNHIDGDKTNNSVENLEWVDNDENRRHAVKEGLHLQGEKCSGAKLTAFDVKKIREIGYSIPRKDLAAMFNVSYQTIVGILSYRTWKNS